MNNQTLPFSVSSIFANLIFGVIGFYLFRAGKQNSNMKHVALGLVLMIYTYFTNGALMEWVIGLGLCGLAYYSRE